MIEFFVLIIAVTVGLTVVGIVIALVNRWEKHRATEPHSLGDVIITQIIILIAAEAGISLVEAWNLWQTQYAPKGCYRMVEL